MPWPLGSHKRAAYSRAYNIRKWYGISMDEYGQLFEKQGKCCAICGTNNPRTKSGRNPWHVDHDHETKQVRGILCFRCNVMLGNSGDDTGILQRAIGYLNGVKKC
jgi:hypothetical protein